MKALSLTDAGSARIVDVAEPRKQDGELLRARRFGVRAPLRSTWMTRSLKRSGWRPLTDGDGPDVVIEAIGLPETLRLAVEEVAFTGRVIHVGYAKEPVAYETKLFVQKELGILGSRNALPRDFLNVMAMLEAGRFPGEEMVSAMAPLDRGPAMLAEWSAKPAAFTKILIEVQR